MNHAETIRKQIQAVSFLLAMITINIISRMIGYNGVTYTMLCIEIYGLVFTLLCGGVTEGYGRVLRMRNTRAQNKSPISNGRNVMIMQGILGVIGLFAMLALGELIAVKFLHLQYCINILVWFSPAILLRAITAGLLCFERGRGSELPNAISGIMRQVLTLLFSLIFCKMLTGYGRKVSHLLKQDNFIAMYGGMGVAIAISVSELLVVIFLFLIYSGNRSHPMLDTNDKTRGKEHFLETFFSIQRSRWVSMGVILLLILPTLTGMLFIGKAADDINELAIDYGILVSVCLVLGGIFFSLFLVYLYPHFVNIQNYYRKNEKRYAKAVFRQGMNVILILSLYMTVFIAMSRKEWAAVLCPEYVEMGAQLLFTASFILPLSCLFFYFGQVLSLFGKRILLLAALAGGNIINMITIPVLLKVGTKSIEAILCGYIFSSIFVTVVTGVLAFLQLRQKIDILRSIFIPFMSTCLAGLLCLLIVKLASPHLGSAFTIILSFIVTFPIQLIANLIFRSLSEQDLEMLPGGQILIKLGRILHIY